VWKNCKLINIKKLNIFVKQHKADIFAIRKTSCCVLSSKYGAFSEVTDTILEKDNG